MRGDAIVERELGLSAESRPREPRVIGLPMPTISPIGSATAGGDIEEEVVFIRGGLALGEGQSGHHRRHRLDVVATNGWLTRSNREQLSGVTTTSGCIPPHGTIDYKRTESDAAQGNGEILRARNLGSGAQIQHSPVV